MHTTNMIEHPILFQTEMVKAIMAEQKTQTRRCNGLKTINENPSNWVFKGIDNGYPPYNGGWGAVFENVDGDRTRVKVPYGIVGHCMWVRETWKYLGVYDDGQNSVEYKDGTTYEFYPSDGREDYWIDKGEKLADVMIEKDKAEVDADADRITWKAIDVPWKPSIHMPRDIARNFIKVTGGRIERLNDITDEDCIAEGVRFDKDSGYYFAGDKIMTSSEKWAFVQLWESINGQNSWDKNPWVWVYDFKLITDRSNN